MQVANYQSETLEHSDSVSDTVILSNRVKPFEEGVKADVTLQIISAERACPIAHAMISIDSIGMTAVCNHSGITCLKALPAGTYSIDIISAGYIAQTVIVNISDSVNRNLQVMMVSNI